MLDEMLMEMLDVEDLAAAEEDDEAFNLDVEGDTSGEH